MEGANELCRAGRLILNDEDTLGRPDIEKNTEIIRLHVEIAVPSTCPLSLKEIRILWTNFLNSGDAEWIGSSIDPRSIPEEIGVTMERLVVVSDSSDEPMQDINNADLRIHCFVLSEEDPAVEELEPAHDGDDDFITACDNTTLPHKSLCGAWKSLIYHSSIKANLLRYAESALLFSDKGVSNHVVNWNRMIFLHGPPGTGKTSLCRALAHKLAIRLSHRYTSTQLLEIHSHSLFSKWFSASGKLINRLFELVRDMIEDDPKVLVCVLLDEIESLAVSRSNLGDGDPSDSMRAVNALLTSLDRLKVFPNVLVLATTNLTNKVDPAFCDRADLKVFVGPPIKAARIEILNSCLQELVRVGLVESKGIPDWGDVAEASDGLSGRSLRRLPLQAYALFLFSEPIPIPLSKFLKALLQTIEQEQKMKLN